MFASRSKNHIRDSLFDRVALTVNGVLLTVFLAIILYPLLYVVTASFSGGITTLSLNLWPKTISLEGYKAVFEYAYVWIGYRNSLFYASLGTLISLAVTICCAYPLSRSDLKGGKYMMILCMITMYFSGGLIPSYLLMRTLNLLDKVWVMMLPGALSVYNMIVMRTYFKTAIPGDLREAAQLDGCGDFKYLTAVVLPLSGPIVAVISLYVAVGIWNSYFGPMIYTSTRDIQPLSLFLREILVVNTMDLSANINIEEMEYLQKRQQVMKYSLIIVSSIPVMLLYPFIQKYFVKGVMIGAVKG